MVHNLLFFLATAGDTSGGHSQTIIVIIAVVAAIVGPLVAYFSASRRLSGRIKMSEAESLWTESSKIREDYRERVNDLEKRVGALERDNNVLSRENIDLTRKLVEYEQIIKNLRERLEFLEHENSVLHGLVDAQQREIPNEPL